MSAAALFIRGTHSPSCVSALAGWLAGRHCVSGDLTRFLLFPRRGVFTFAAAFLFFGAARPRLDKRNRERLGSWRNSTTETRPAPLPTLTANTEHLYRRHQTHSASLRAALVQDDSAGVGGREGENI